MKKGFSLLEVIMAIALFSLLSLGISTLYLGYKDMYFFSSIQVSTTEQARSALKEITKYTLEANRVLSSYGEYSSGSNSLVLKLYSINQAGDVLDGKWDYVYFYTLNSKLYRQIQSDSQSSRISGTKFLADNVTLSFTYNDPDFEKVNKISVDIQIQKQAKTRQTSIHLSQQLLLRNY